MISKELAKVAVICCPENKTVLEIEYASNYENFILIKSEHKNGSTSNMDINIYEVAHKCKEWAFKKGYTILSYPSSSVLIFNTDIKDTCYNTNFENPKKYDPICDIEVCEWIIEKELSE